MRDLATYETNFGGATGLGPRLQATQVVIQKTLGLFAQGTCWQAEDFSVDKLLSSEVPQAKEASKKCEHSNGMLSDDQINKVIATLQQLKGAKR